jgi:hypothetical protein
VKLESVKVKTGLFCTFKILESSIYVASPFVFDWEVAFFDLPACENKKKDNRRTKFKSL